MKLEDQYRTTWDLYTQSWKLTKRSERLEIFKLSLDPECCYTDPLVRANGWDALIAYMEQFHLQIPNGSFETVSFLSHHNLSLTTWNMKNGDGVKIGEGSSLGEYAENGKLLKMTGFYK